MTGLDGTKLTGWAYCNSRCAVINNLRGVYSIEAWMQPASLKKRGGTKIKHIFVEIGGKEKLRGGDRLNYLSTCLHCLSLIFSKIFSLATLARLAYILFSCPNQVTRNIYGRDGKVRLTFKSGVEKRRLLMT